MPDSPHPTTVPLATPTRNADGYYPMEAVEWRVGPAADIRQSWGLREVRICAMTQRDGRTLYAVQEAGWCANKDREWELSPQPSSRDDEFFARCRWESWEDAAKVAQHMVYEMLHGRWPVAGQEATHA